MRVYNTKSLFLFLILFLSCRNENYKEYIFNPNLKIDNCESQLSIKEFSFIIDNDNSFPLIICEAKKNIYSKNEPYYLFFSNKKYQLFTDGNNLETDNNDVILFELKFVNYKEEQNIMKYNINSVDKKKINYFLENVNFYSKDNKICFSKDCNFNLLDRRN